MEIYWDPIGRLGMCEACAIETYHWLSKGLMLGEKFKERIILLDSWKVDDKSTELYPSNSRFFLSAPDQLVSSQLQNLEDSLPIKLDLKEVVLDLSGENETMAEHRERYQKTDTFYILPFMKDWGSAAEADITYNDFLHQESVNIKELARTMTRKRNQIPK